MKKLKKSTIAFFTAIIGAILGALGGAEKSSKLFRRIGIPVLLLLIGLLFKNYAAILISLYISIFYIGYGIPEPIKKNITKAKFIYRIEDYSDQGSTLGRFWYILFRGSNFLADIFTKAMIGALFSVILAIISISKHNSFLLLLTIPLTILSHVIFGGLFQGLGEIKLFNRKFTGIELARYFFLTLAAVIQLIF